MIWPSSVQIGRRESGHWPEAGLGQATLARRRRLVRARDESAMCYYYEISILNIKAFVGLLFLLLAMAALLFLSLIHI